jgi:glycosyltransferase involved in cell wall biosynthesis
LGGLIYDKGVHILIESFRKVTGSVMLKIYGEGKKEYTDLLMGIAKNDSKIFFKGKYDHQQIGEILSRSHILIVPSIWEEAYGLVIQEGLAARIPIIASDIGGIKEQIFDGVNGFLVKANDVSTLANKIQYVINNYNKIESQLKYDISLKSISQNSEMLSDIYEALIRKELIGNSSYLFQKR